MAREYIFLRVLVAHGLSGMEEKWIFFSLVSIKLGPNAAIAQLTQVLRLLIKYQVSLWMVMLYGQLLVNMLSNIYEEKKYVLHFAICTI
jgi:hypothetical protein